MCDACGKLFPRVHARLCPACFQIEDNRFAIVRDYLKRNEGAPIAEIADATGISRGDISRFMTAGRLVATDSEGTVIGSACTCASGGGRCAYCKRRLAGKFRALQDTGPRATLGELAAAEGAPEDGSAVRYVRRARRQADGER